jgi:hypothetical protein
MKHIACRVRSASRQIVFGVGLSVLAATAAAGCPALPPEPAQRVQLDTCREVRPSLETSDGIALLRNLESQLSHIPPAERKRHLELAVVANTGVMFASEASQVRQEYFLHSTSPSCGAFRPGAHLVEVRRRCPMIPLEAPAEWILASPPKIAR